jgi:hypothetical protein
MSTWNQVQMKENRIKFGSSFFCFQSRPEGSSTRSSSKNIVALGASASGNNVFSGWHFGLSPDMNEGHHFLLTCEPMYHRASVVVVVGQQWRPGEILTGAINRAHFLTFTETIGVRFVTTDVTDLKLCTYVPLSDRNLETKFRSDLIPGFTTRGL